MEFNEKSSNNLKMNDEEINENIFFKIYYNNKRNTYYLIDMKIGYGTFYKIEEETIIKENSIINIGESYLIFSFNKNNLETNQEMDEDDLFLKIYSNDALYNPMIISSKNENKKYKFGRIEKCDVVIRDNMLSRIHCLLYYQDNADNVNIILYNTIYFYIYIFLI